MARFSDFMIADGMLKEIHRDQQDITLCFEDFTHNQFDLILHACSALEEHDAIGYSLSRGELTTLATGLLFELFDDDGCVLRARCQRYSVKPLPDRDQRP
jgi:hypothetical protein